AAECSPPGGKALGGTQTRDVEEVLELEPALPLHMQPDPVAEVAEPVAEAPVDRVLEMRMGVDESGQDHRVGEPRALAELGGGPDGDDAASLDRNRAALDRGACDGEHPVCGVDLHALAARS